MPENDRSGTRMPSSTRCTFALSSTASATDIGDFQGLTQKLDYLQDLGDHGGLALAILSFAAARTTATTSPTTRHPPALRQSRRLQGASCEAAHERGIRVITELVINHTSDQHPWFQRAPARPAGQPGARLLCLERQAREVQGRPGDLPGLRAVELELGSGRQGLLLAPLLLASARPQLRQPGGLGGDLRQSSSSGSRWASTA